MLHKEQQTKIEHKKSQNFKSFVFLLKLVKSDAQLDNSVFD